MNTISIPNNTYYSSVNNKQKIEQNTNFKGHGVSGEGNVYKESNIGKYVLTSISFALTAFYISNGLRVFSKGRLRNRYIKQLLKERLVNTFSAFGLGTVVDMIINKVRSNRADKRANELYTYVQNMNAPQQPYPQYQETLGSGI